MDREELQNRYCSFMSEIKARLQSIYDMMEDDKSKITFVIVLESCYLQLRIISELIAISSLSAHGELLEKIPRSLSGEYSARDIIKAAERLHPNFYPMPGRHIIGPNGVITHVEEIEGEFLCKSELKELYKECNSYLHRGQLGNVLAAKAKILDQERIWHRCRLIVNLLDHHQIQTVDDDIMYCVEMRSGERGHVRLAAMKKSRPQ